MRGWPSFNTDTFDLMNNRIDAANWPSTRTHQLILAQTTALKFHYGENISRARLLNAAHVLGRYRGPYVPTTVDDILFDIFHRAMIPEMRSFAMDGIRLMAVRYWNKRAGDHGFTDDEIRTHASDVPRLIDEYLSKSHPFALT
jgi:hypothetical protein